MTQQLTIAGQAISFPYKPYPSQLQLMERCIKAANNKQVNKIKMIKKIFDEYLSTMFEPQIIVFIFQCYYV
jgi:hypothetical protein